MKNWIEQIGVSDVIAIAGLIVAIISLVWSFFNDRKLKSLQIKEHEHNDAIRKRALLRLETGFEGRTYKIFIHNDGMAAARNIRISPENIDETYGVFLVEGTFPYPVLNPKEKLSSNAFLAQVRPENPVIEIIWDDDFSKDNKRECVLTFLHHFKDT